MSLGFLKKFRKNLEKMEDVTTDNSPPAFWYSIGNYAVNKAVSGSFTRGIPQGRLTAISGPSGSGKSFLLCNILKNAQDDGAFILALDTENALDRVYMRKIGMSMAEDKFQYAGVTTLNDVVEIISDFIKEYVSEYGYDNLSAPKVIIALDSIDMLLTESEDEQFNKGEQKGSQGQPQLQRKKMLKLITSRIKRLPFAFILTHQVYPNMDITNGQGTWIVNNAIRYSCSQIMLVTALKLKDGADILGVRMRVEAYKSRFAKPGTKAEIEVPYTSGINKFSHVVDMLEEQNIIKSSGAWKTLELPNQEPIKFQTKNLDEELFQKILSHPIIQEEEKTILELMNVEEPEETTTN